VIVIVIIIVVVVVVVVVVDRFVIYRVAMGSQSIFATQTVDEW